MVVNVLTGASRSAGDVKPPEGIKRSKVCEMLPATASCITRRPLGRRSRLDVVCLRHLRHQRVCERGSRANSTGECVLRRSRDYNQAACER